MDVVRQHGGMRNERGMAPSLEAAILLPALATVVGLIIVLAHVALAEQEVRSIVSAAARAASVERSPGEGRRAAHQLIQGAKTCQSAAAGIDVSDLGKQPGVPGDVRITLTCTVRLASVGFSAFPGTVTITSDVTSPVDRFRSR